MPCISPARLSCVPSPAAPHLYIFGLQSLVNRFDCFMTEWRGFRLWISSSRSLWSLRSSAVNCSHLWCYRTSDKICSRRPSVVANSRGPSGEYYRLVEMDNINTVWSHSNNSYCSLISENVSRDNLQQCQHWAAFSTSLRENSRSPVSTPASMVWLCNFALTTVPLEVFLWHVTKSCVLAFAWHCVATQCVLFLWYCHWAVFSCFPLLFLVM